MGNISSELKTYAFKRFCETGDVVDLEMVLSDRNGDTLLYVACEKGHVECVERLLNVEGVYVNRSMGSEGTPLYVACRKGHVEIVERLLKVEGVDVNEDKKDKGTPLHVACRGGHVECVERLLKVKRVDVNKATRSEGTPLHAACERGHVECVEMLLDWENDEGNAAIDVNVESRDGKTALVKAMDYKHFGCISRLLQVERLNDRDVFNAVKFLQTLNYTNDNDDHTMRQLSILSSSALLLASQKGLEGLVNSLIELRRCDINATNKEKSTAIMLASQNGCDMCLALLVKVDNIAVNATDRNKTTALIMACQNGHHECVTHLLRIPTIDVNAKNSEGNTALLIATNQGHVDIIKRLLKMPQVDVNAANNESRTPLMLACNKGSFEMVSCLLKRVDIDFCLRDQHGETALTLARYEKHTDCLNRLFTMKNIIIEEVYKEVKKEIDKEQDRNFGWFDSFLRNSSIDADLRDNISNIALKMASRKGQKVLVEILLQVIDLNEVNIYQQDIRTQLEHLNCDRFFDAVWKEINRDGEIRINYIERLLKNRNIGLDKRRQVGERLLISSSQKGLGDLVSRLIDMKFIDTNAKDSKQSTALMKACYKGNIMCAEHLLKNPNTDVNAQNLDGLTALMLASLKGNFECLERLLRMKGINVNATDKKHRTALMRACNEGKTDYVRLLLRTEAIDVNVKCESGYSALMMASYQGHSDCVEILLHEKGAIDDSVSEAYNIAIDNNDFTCIALLHPIADPYEKLLATMMNDQEQVNAKHDKGGTALTEASSRGCTARLPEAKNIPTGELYRAVKREIDKEQNRDFEWIDRFLMNTNIDAGTRRQLHHFALRLASNKEQTDLVEILRRINIGDGCSVLNPESFETKKHEL